MVVYILSWFSSGVAGCSVILSLAHRRVPAPKGVLCLVTSFSIMLLLMTLLKLIGIGAFFWLWMPVSKTAYRSILWLDIALFILSSFDRLFLPYGTPLTFCMRIFMWWLLDTFSRFHVCYVCCYLVGTECYVDLSLSLFHMFGYSAALLKKFCELPKDFGTSSTVWPLTLVNS